MVFSSCNKDEVSINYDFNSLKDRTWIGEDFFSVPLEDWRIKDGKIEYTGTGQQATCTILPYILNKPVNSFTITLNMGISEKGQNDGAAGLIVGSQALEEEDHRAAVFFGNGINIGVNTQGFAYIGQKTEKLPDDFNWDSFSLQVKGKKDSENFMISLGVLDIDGKVVAEVSAAAEKPVSGIVQIVNNARNSASKENGPGFWFDNIKLEGSGFTYIPENRFGPVMWTMYTLSNNILKLTAQMPPVSPADNQTPELRIKNNDEWVTAGSAKMDPDSRTATFKIENWDSSKEKEYKVLYSFTDISGKENIHEYSGKIKSDPVDRPLKLGAMTCQYNNGFPYSPLFKNLQKKEPDLLYFSGDQIYEINGGYQIKREPEDIAILNYLGKWYMFGWAFRDLMRDVPTICTPDDHDVFQGNLWGGQGIRKPSGLSNSDDYTGFTQTVKMVNVVNTTQCSHLPDPYDPTPIGEGMKVWYTSLNYGRVSFAIVSDRIFKSGPDRVAWWQGRKDHLKEPIKNPDVLEKPGLEFLGQRQESFLENWIRDWRGTDMKVLLSQTMFANVATHHGQADYFLLGDMDSGGWPKKGRDKAISIIRKGFAFHISGDQHIPSLVQYGLKDYRDAGWSFVPPAIATGYARWFRPDEMKYEIRNRPEHGLPNTGEYKDAFWNLNYVYAVGNPGNFQGIRNRYELLNQKSAGFGFVIFDNDTRNITIESWHLLADLSKPEEGQFPGWPLTINQMDNYGRKAIAWLPTLKINGDADPVVEIINQNTGEPEYIVRINGNEFTPKVFSKGRYRINVSYPEKNLSKEINDIEALDENTKKELEISF